MVQLNRIITKTGDDGSTSLGDGNRVPKTHPRIAALGTVDELNAALGLAIATTIASADRHDALTSCLQHVQSDLFDLGADLCVPLSRNDDADHDADADGSSPLRITSAYVQRLESWADEVNERLSPLSSFLLPGGTLLAAHLHMARTICRRAERDILTLSATESLGTPLLQYVNRLSDLLFIFARSTNNDGQQDILWKPGGDRSRKPTKPPSIP